MDSVTEGEQIVNYENLVGDVENYLINNYKEALNRGDKWAAKSYLLTARYFSLNDQDVTNEIYLMAKADGDATEASKCFSKIFNDLFIMSNEDENSTSKTDTDQFKQLKNQIKEETKYILCDLETKFLKLKSTAGLHLDTSQSNDATTDTSPVTSHVMLASPKPRMRMISVESRDSISRLDNYQLISSQKSLTNVRKSFYQQLFENLPEETKRNILYYSIETCDNNLIEACKLMMLTISIFNDSVITYGSRLLRSLMSLSNQTKTDHDGTNINSSNDTCKYAKSLLVLDAIPLVLNMTSLTNLDIDTEELFERTLNFYSEHYLEAAAKEHQVNELHEAMKKLIASRILGIENKTISDELREDYLIGTLRFLSLKFMETVTDASVKSKFDELRCLISDRTDLNGKFTKIHNIIQNLNLEVDVPDDVLFNTIKHDSSGSSVGSSQQVVTPPPKTRGRPKKNQSQQQQSVIVSLDDGVKRHLHNKSREIQFVFHLIVEYMFVNCAKYLKNSKSRILFNYDNPLLLHIAETGSTKTTSGVSSAGQKTSKSKNNPQPTNETSPSSSTCHSPTKKIKLDAKISKVLSLSSNSRESPLNSEQARKMDKQVLDTLTQAQECLNFLQDPANGIYNKLWEHYCKTNLKNDLSWFRRIQVDSLILSSKYEQVLDILNNDMFTEPVATDDTVITQTEQSESQSCSVTTISVNSTASSIARLRTLIQSISCYVQLADKTKTLEKIDDLLTVMKQSGLLAEDICPYENILDEYMIRIQHDKVKSLGFLLFESMSLVRYCVNILTSIHKRYTLHSNITTDETIGHAIVLSQFDWPKESLFYDYSVTWIRTQKPKSTTPQTLSAATKFTYPEFFSYIRNPNIIEDFMSMLCLGYTLDIKGPTTGSSGSGSQNSTGSSTRGNIGSSTRSSKMITTRGVNKTFKEDLKAALISQMKNSSIILPLELIAEFIQENLISYINSSYK